MINKCDLVLNWVTVGYPRAGINASRHQSEYHFMPKYIHLCYYTLVGMMRTGGPRHHEACAALLSIGLDVWVTSVSVSTAERSPVRGKTHGIRSKPAVPYVTSYASTWIAEVRDAIEVWEARIRLGVSTSHCPLVDFP